MRQTLARRFAGVRHEGRTAVSTPYGAFWIDPVSILGRRLSAGQVPEPETVRALEAYLSPGSVFVDLGANEGLFTVQAAKRCGERGRVVAVEPQPRCREVLERNCQLNACSNVTIVPLAVSDRTGTMTLYLSGSTNTGATSLVRPGHLARNTIRVSCMPLDQLLDSRGVRIVDLLKMDIEGGEYEAVLGSPALFHSGRIRALALEYHPDILGRRKHRPLDIHEFLLAGGYEIDPVLNACDPPGMAAGLAVYRWTPAGLPTASHAD